MSGKVKLVPNLPLNVERGDREVLRKRKYLDLTTITSSVKLT